MRPTDRLLTATALAAASIALTAASATTAFAGGFDQRELSGSTAGAATSVSVSAPDCDRDGGGKEAAKAVGEKCQTGKESAGDRDKEASGDRAKEAGDRGKEVAGDRGKEASGDRAREPDEPTGHVRTGVGGSVSPDTHQIAAGVAVLAAAAVGGTWLLHRRASGAQVS